MARISLEPIVESLTNCMMICDCCGWEGSIYSCIPDVDGDGALGCPGCAANNNIGDDLHEKVTRFELTFRRISNYDIQVLLNDQFLIQFRHSEQSPEFYLAQDLRDVANIIAQLSLIGQRASEATILFREKAKKELYVSKK